MPQYTSSATNRGVVVNTVLDTTTDVQTITVTLPSGQTATTTVPGNTEGVPTSASQDIQAQFLAQGVTVYDGPSVTKGVRSTTTDVVNQNAVASRASEASGNPPPAESQPIPVATADNPNPVPPPDTNFLDANAAPQQLIDPNTDPNTNIGSDVQTSSPQVPIDDGSDPYVSNGNTTIETITSPNSITENVFDPRQEVTENVFDPRQEVTENVFDPTSGGPGGYKGLQGSTNEARAKQITQDAENAKTQGDWRVRLSLAPGADYLYKAENPGILKYLQSTDGIVFPYTPQISVNYAAHYDPAELTHSNYKVYQYKNSSVDQISITCDFTAQDTYEANYLLAVIHFFRSVTKMFYGKDQNPKPGTPPPLCYLSGLGAFQFDKHPLVISGFNYSLPNDVDYIRASSPTLQPGVDSTAYDSKGTDSTPTTQRLKDATLNVGATQPAPRFTGNKATNTEPTYVPTKIQISISAYPIVSRYDISNNFSLKDYATGKLLQGSKNPSGGGIW